jgi:hypothetical protein
VEKGDFSTHFPVELWGQPYPQFSNLDGMAQKKIYFDTILYKESPLSQAKEDKKVQRDCFPFENAIQT